MSLCDILIPTWNLPEYAVPCVESILRNLKDQTVHIYVINNGREEHVGYFPKSPNVTIIQMPENAGWEGGLKEGLKHSNSPYVVFMNDDTFIPQFSTDWLHKLMRHFVDPACGAVGPSSNVVMGKQQMFDHDNPFFMVNFLIGFCMLLRS